MPRSLLKKKIKYHLQWHNIHEKHNKMSFQWTKCDLWLFPTGFDEMPSTEKSFHSIAVEDIQSPWFTWLLRLLKLWDRFANMSINYLLIFTTQAPWTIWREYDKNEIFYSSFSPTQQKMLAVLQNLPFSRLKEEEEKEGRKEGELKSWSRSGIFSYISPVGTSKNNNIKQSSGICNTFPPIVSPNNFVYFLFA